MPRKTKDLTGRRFGDLEILKFAGYKKWENSTRATWLCKCDCGTIKTVNAIDLLQGKAKSCGCRKHKSNIIDVTGQRFGKLVVLEMLAEKGKKTNCRCICDCGNETIVNSYQLRIGKTRSCGCLRREQGSRIEDLTGKRFGKLTALTYVGKTKGKTRWLCKCDCGNEVVAYASNLKSGHSLSCGCLQHPLYGLSTKRIYHIYSGMMARCFNKNNICYKHYGNRGITVCDEWSCENGLFNFAEWALENGYSDELSIDRIDVNGNYEPSNCRWADKIMQANNKTTTLKLTLNGETKSVNEWAREIGINHQTIRARKKRGWTDEQCLTVPLNGDK